ncbi:SDR family oxidoreductase [Oryzifoliimicrobium ureilyticus]|uniref:SDR family oxidoreductase n=1 Tax=Oryzifoliimicrobium ureilyticus TaxID=3113724 RepID=UPI003075FB2D
MSNVVIFGCGFSGLAIARAFLKQNCEVWGTTRSEPKALRLEEEGVKPLVFDGMTFGDDVLKAVAKADILVQSIAPGDSGDPLLNLGYEHLRKMMPNLRWMGYLSTIGVYGNHDGAWVSEETPCKPVSARSRERREAEDGWIDFSKTSGCSVAILRLSGIYGPGRNAFCNLAAGTARRLIKKDQVFNRIRAEDIAEATVFLSERQLGGIYNVTDDNPAPPQDVIVEAARLMGVEPPPEQQFETAELSPMARSFYGENKRVSNEKLKSAGFRFLYPDYPQSLSQLWRTGSWKGEE